MDKRQKRKDKQGYTKHTQTGMNSGAPDGYEVPAPLAIPIVLLFV